MKPLNYHIDMWKEQILDKNIRVVLQSNCVRKQTPVFSILYRSLTNDPNVPYVIALTMQEGYCPVVYPENKEEYEFIEVFEGYQADRQTHWLSVLNKGVA